MTEPPKRGKKKNQKTKRQKQFANLRASIKRRAWAKKKMAEAIFCEDCKVTFQPNSKSQTKTFDHIIPLSKGGPNTEANIAIVCQPCNVKKGGRMPGEPAKKKRKKNGPRKIRKG